MMRKGFRFFWSGGEEISFCQIKNENIFGFALKKGKLFCRN
jgi:hypothetical protein